MAEFQRKIKPALKRQLVEQAGGKCANPGCANWRVHIHHIKHWAVYKAHEAADMIAVCPSCHDASHHGRLKISDDLLYTWKGIVRPNRPEAVHIFVEPSPSLKLLTGSIAIATKNEQAAVFDLSNSNNLKLRILDKDVLLVSARLQDQKNREIFRVTDNYVRVSKSKDITFDYRPGRARITVPLSNNFAPQWLIDQVRFQEPNFAKDARIVAFDIEVVKPGLVRVQGCWPNGDVGIVITERALSFCVKGLREPISHIGGGEDTVLMFDGPITGAMFGFKS